MVLCKIITTFAKQLPHNKGTKLHTNPRNPLIYRMLFNTPISAYKVSDRLFRPAYQPCCIRLMPLVAGFYDAF